VVKQVQGVQDYQPVHHDPDYARADGRQGVFMNTGFTQGACSRVIEDWIGDKGFLTFFPPGNEKDEYAGRHYDFQRQGD